MTITTKAILGSLTLLGVADGADVPEWMTRWLLVGALGIVQFFFSRQVAALDKKVETFDQHVKDMAVMRSEMNVIQAIGGLKADLALSDRTTRMEGRLDYAVNEIDKMRPHVHDIAEKLTGALARAAREGHPP